MDWGMVENNWENFQDKVKGRWTRLSSIELHAVAGKRDLLVGLIRETYDIVEQDAEMQVREFELRNRDYQPWTTSCSKWRLV